MDDKTKKALREELELKDIKNRVFSRLAKKHGLDVVLDFVNIYDEEYPDRGKDGRRSFHVPTMETITRKAHSRMF